MRAVRTFDGFPQMGDDRRAWLSHDGERHNISMLNALQDRQRGAAMPEYGLLVALIAIAAVAATTNVGLGVAGKFTEIAGKLGIS